MQKGYRVEFKEIDGVTCLTRVYVDGVKMLTLPRFGSYKKLEGILDKVYQQGKVQGVMEFLQVKKELENNGKK